MRIPWKIKSLAFAGIDALHMVPLLYFVQKYVTRRARHLFTAPLSPWLFHAENLGAQSAPAVLEFGAGKDLAQNIYLSPHCGSQTLVDLHAMFDPVLADAAAVSISRFAPVTYHKISGLKDLARYGISYHAPLDMARPGFADNSFDACISTSTLEHIPEGALRAILRELRRVLKPDGIVSAVIDTSDHYSHTDKSIGPLEFLRFEDYRHYNHRSHFQNRLRHGDFERLFKEAGFTVKRAEARDTMPPPRKIAVCFDPAMPNVFATESRFVLVNNKT